MKAIFAVPIENANAVLPPMSAGVGEIQLHYTEGGVLRGGYSLIGHAPVDGVPGVLVLVDASEETIQAMHDSPVYLWIEDVAEDAEPESDVKPVEVSIEREA